MLLHFSYVIFFECFSYRLVNRAFPQSKKISEDFETKFAYQKKVDDTCFRFVRPDQEIALSGLMSRARRPEKERIHGHAVFIYTLWLSAIVYSFVYFVVDLLCVVSLHEENSNKMIANFSLK